MSTLVKERQLPVGWVNTTLGNIVTFEYGKGLPKERRDKNGNVPVYGSSGIVGHHSSPLINEPSLIVGRKGAIGSVFLSKGPSWPIDTTYFVIPPKQMNLQYVFHLLKTLALNSLDKSTAIPGLNRNDAYRTNVQIAPLNEQRRIVGKVEELFSFLDAGVASLRKVQAQLKRYRQAVLKYAFEGKLTEEWRRTHKDQIEPAQKLLERIKQERKQKLGTKYKELPLVNTTEMPKLPENWIWIRIGEISERLQYGTSEKASTKPSGLPVLRMGNIQEGKIVFDNLKYFSEEWPQLNEFLLKEGDLLFNRTNSAELVGKTAVYREHYPKAVFASYLIRVQTDKMVYIPEILSFFINSFYGRKYIASVVSQQVGQANVNGTKLSLMPIPLIPHQEQILIQQEIERCSSIADKMEEATEQSLKQAERLRQSILKMAFEGKLVPQDPTDEPAEKLLARIKAESFNDRKSKINNQLELTRYVK